MERLLRRVGNDIMDPLSGQYIWRLGCLDVFCRRGRVRLCSCSSRDILCTLMKFMQGPDRRRASNGDHQRSRTLRTMVFVFLGGRTIDDATAGGGLLSVGDCQLQSDR